VTATQPSFVVSLIGDFDILQVGGIDPTFGDRAAPALYVPSSPTGWRSSGARKGPDPNFTRGVRRGGLGA
jgi:hypothetical protein